MAYSLEEMEKYLQDMYEKAGKGLEQKAVQYMLDFKRLEEQHKRDVESGKWTQDEFDTWRKNKLLYGTHWTRIIQTVQRDMAKVNQTALDYINGKIPQIFAQTYNEVAEKVPKSPVSGYSFELVNADTVKNLVHEEGIILPPKKNLDKQKDKLWNAKQVNAQLLQGILQGESIKKIAARMQNVANADLVGATRTARTMCTAAENSGRQSAYNRAAEDGIKFTKTWVAALQGNTRDTHKYLNQQTQPHDKPFESSSGAVLMFPGDWHAPPAEVYNCRCTMITNFIGFDKVKLKEAVERQEQLERHVHEIVQGRDLSREWERRSDEFAFEIEDVMNAQGFDGLPQVVTAEEFERAVQESGFVAQRAYFAPDRETLDAYREQLYYGSWYVDCSTGGAQYGQGMYCAADYTGAITQGMKNEMQHYLNLNNDRCFDSAYDIAVSEAYNKKTRIPTREEFKKTYSGGGYIETLTLSPDAKIIKYSDIERLKYNDTVDYIVAQKLFPKDKFSDEELALLYSNYENTFSLYFGDYDKLDKIKELSKTIGDMPIDEWNKKYDEKDTALIEWWEYTYKKQIKSEVSAAKKRADMNDGAWAALMGYDAINAEGHGESGSYTVILNRTKLIIKDGNEK